MSSSSLSTHRRQDLIFMLLLNFFLFNSFLPTYFCFFLKRFFLFFSSVVGEKVKIYEKAKKRNREQERRNGNKIGLDIFICIYPYERNEIYYETYFIEEMNIKMRFSWSIDENKDGKCADI